MSRRPAIDLPAASPLLAALLLAALLLATTLLAAPPPATVPSAVVLTASAEASPILRRHDRPDARHRQLARELPALVEVADAAGTLIAPRWVLTAAHVVEGWARDGQPAGLRSVRLAGRRIAVAEVVLHPGWPAAGCDIALVRLAAAAGDHGKVARREDRGGASAPPALATVPICRRQEEQGKQVYFVGRGGSGDGRTGPILFDRRLRAATNRIEKADGAWLLFRFDPPPGGEELEGISGPGDSGGPAYIERADGSLCVAGVSSWQDNRAQRNVEGVYGVWEHYARVSAYAAWIDQVTGGASTEVLGDGHGGSGEDGGGGDR